MKIAFWSNTSELCSVSSDLAAISVVCAIQYDCSIIAMENRLCHYGLGKAYNGGSRAELLDEVGTNYYDGCGMEGLLRKIYRGDYHPRTLKTYLKEIINQRLYYIPQSRAIHNEIFDYELEHCLHPLFELMEAQCDLCFIDTASNNNLSSKIILEEADLIVVNLSGKPSLIDDFFLNYSSLISKSIFILDHSYSQIRQKPRSLGITNVAEGTSFKELRQISKFYHVPLDHLFTIPENEAYQNNYQLGYVHEFISRNLSCTRENPNYHFICSISKIADTIMQRYRNKQRDLDTCGRL